MDLRRRLGVCLLTAAVVVAVNPSGSATAAPAQATAASAQVAATSAPAPARASKTVTLITGDKVQVSDLPGGTKGLVVTPAKGREHGVRFFKQTKDKDIILLPTDAAALVAAGKLDRDLFNVSALIRQRFDDASSKTLPLIVTYPDTPGVASRSVLGGGAVVARELPSVRGLAVTQPKTGDVSFWRSVTQSTAGNGREVTVLSNGIGTIRLDRKFKASLDRSVPQIGAPAAWQAGYTGKGVKVAVLDTGVDAAHPDLASAVIDAKDFTGSASGPSDQYGHGSHVASILAGSGAAAGGRYKGVAPDAKILNGKVLDDAGEGLGSWIIAGMEWAAAQGATVANLSLGADDTPEIDSLEAAVNDLTARTGILFVIAAGNGGEDGDQTIGSPGSAAAALTVAAVDRSDKVTEWSSRGPNQGAIMMKPDIAAPGLEIVAAKAGPPNGNPYIAHSGTSMATPHVAGAAAIMRQQHPTLRPEAIKTLLTSAAKPDPTVRAFDQGTGRVDLARAITQQVRTTSPNADFGVLRYPHNGTATTSITYVNDGPAAVTLTTTLRTTGPDGEPMTGLFTAGASQVTVPAGGTADLAITMRATSRHAHGAYSGHLAARTADGRTAVQAVVGVVLEGEMYDVTIKQLDRDGNLVKEGNSWLMYVRVDDEGAGVDAPFGESYKVRVPKGVYHFTVSIATPRDAPTRESYTFIGEPDVKVDRDITLTFDARTAKPVVHTTERKGLTQHVPSISITLDANEKFMDNGLIVMDADNEWNPFFATPSRTAKDKETFTYHYHDARLGSAGSNTTKIKVSDYTVGRVPTELSKHVLDKDLSGLQEQFFRQNAQNFAQRRDFLDVPHEMSTIDAAPNVALPGTMTFLGSVIPGTSWQHELAFEPDEPAPAKLIVEGRKYRKGERKTEKWFQAVNGPTFHNTTLLFSRQGNEIGGYLPFYGDSGGHYYDAGFATRHPKTFSLYREGTLIGTKTFDDDAEFTVPAAAANYKLVVSATPALPWSALSTTIECEWGFRSAGSGAVVYTPLSVVRYAAPTDTENRAAAGSTIRIPVTVQRQPDAEAATVRTLTVEASYDDGKTWTTVPVQTQGNNRTATVNHPALGQTNGFVALRANSTDSKGNTVKQTIIRAYQLR